MYELMILNTVIRTIIIPAGVGLRIIIIFIKMMNEDETHVYKNKLKNIIIFGIVAELIYVIYDLIRLYYIT